MTIFLSVLLSLGCVAFLYILWRSQLRSNIKGLLALFFISTNSTYWGSAFGWEYGLVYGFVLVALFAWLLITLSRSMPAKELRTQPFQKSSFSGTLAISIFIKFLVSVLLSGLMAGAIGLLFHLVYGMVPANSLVGGLFLFLILWPLSMILIIANKHFLKASALATLGSLILILGVYTGVSL